MTQTVAKEPSEGRGKKLCLKRKHGVKWQLFKRNIKMKAPERATLLKHEKEYKRMLHNNLQALVELECTQAGAFRNDICAIKKTRGSTQSGTMGRSLDQGFNT